MKIIGNSAREWDEVNEFSKNFKTTQSVNSLAVRVSAQMRHLDTLSWALDSARTEKIYVCKLCVTQHRNCAESGSETPSVIIIISSISQQQHCTTRDIHSIVRPMQKSNIAYVRTCRIRCSFSSNDDRQWILFMKRLSSPLCCSFFAYVAFARALFYHENVHGAREKHSRVSPRRQTVIYSWTR